MSIRLTQILGLSYDLAKGRKRRSEWEAFADKATSVNGVEASLTGGYYRCSDESTSDEILMAAYQAGNPRAFRTLHDRHGASVYGFLVRRLGDRAAAEDLYQETFLRLHRAMELTPEGETVARALQEAFERVSATLVVLLSKSARTTPLILTVTALAVSTVIAPPVATSRR